MAHREDARTNAGAENRKAAPADGVAAARNDRVAWADFQAKYARGVRRYLECDRQLRRASDEIRRMVHDVLNEGFALTWPAAREADTVQSVLQRLVREAAREYKRRVRREVAIEQIAALPARVYVDPISAMERDQRREGLERWMSRLSVRDRVVLEGPYDGRSDTDIAAELDCAVASVKRRRHRVMERLRREVGTTLPNAPDPPGSQIVGSL